MIDEYFEPTGFMWVSDIYGCRHLINISKITYIEVQKDCNQIIIALDLFDHVIQTNCKLEDLLIKMGG